MISILFSSRLSSNCDPCRLCNQNEINDFVRTSWHFFQKDDYDNELFLELDPRPLPSMTQTNWIFNFRMALYQTKAQILKIRIRKMEKVWSQNKTKNIQARCLSFNKNRMPRVYISLSNSNLCLFRIFSFISASKENWSQL